MGVPVEAAAVRGRGEEELRLAQGESFRDPGPDVPHLLGADDLGGEGVRVQGQVHITPGGGGMKERERERHKPKGRGREGGE